MPNENGFAETSEHTTGILGSLADFVVQEIATVAGQAERERDLLLARKLAELGQREAEHELRLSKLEQELRNRLATLRDGEKGEPGDKGEKGEQGDKGEAINGDKGDPGAPGEKGESVQGEKGEPGEAGRDGSDGSNGNDGAVGPAGARGLDGRSFTIRDTYDPTETYCELDVVTLNATWFIARKDAPGVCPGPDWKAGPTGRRGEKGERGERGPRGEIPNMITSEFPRIVEWDIRAKTYEAFPLMSDGTIGPPIPLRALFEQYQAEAR
jgi:hypothetical protein